MQEIDLKLEAGFVAIRFDNPVDPNARGYEGVDAEVHVRTQGFEGRVRHYFFLSEVRAFLEDLRRCHQRLAGVARLSSDTGSFVLNVEFVTRGRLIAFGELGAYHTPTVLQYQLEGDQSYLYEFFRTLDEVPGET